MLTNELDQRMKPNQVVVHNGFNWPALVEIKIIIAAANMMGEYEVSLCRHDLLTYTTLKLEKIVQARLQCVKPPWENLLATSLDGMQPSSRLRWKGLSS